MLQSRLCGDVLEIVMDNPPVNALGARLRQGLSAAISAGQDDDRVKAIVIRGSGRLFSGGADITEFDRQDRVEPTDGAMVQEVPDLPEVIEQIERCAKPVVAAIHGMALGGGLELALGCNYRIATSDAKLGLPEVMLGLLPGAGGTQRLPRLVGAGKALEMIVSGTPVSGVDAQNIGLIDVAVDDHAELAHRAIAYARTLEGPRPASDRCPSDGLEAIARFEERNARRLDSLDAVKASVEAIRACVEGPVAAGFEKERALFRQVVTGDQSKALRHLFFAERAAAKLQGLPTNTALRKIEQVGIVGAGTMGMGIAINFLSAGIACTIVEMSQQALDRGAAMIGKTFQDSVTKGRITAEQAEKAVSLLNTTLDFGALRTCDLIIEAVYEDMAVKQEIFGRLDAIAKPGAILASNTSYLSIDEIAAATGRPQDVLGLHFFSPANIMKLVEVVRGAKTAPDALATAMGLARRIGKVPVVSGVCHGFIGNRMLNPRQWNAEALLMEGASVEQIDTVLTAFGMPMGPFQMMDLAGVDIGWHRDPSRVDTLREALCAAGRWGQKSGAGFYDYDDHRNRTNSSLVSGIVDDFRRKLSVSLREIPDEEVIVRTLYPMINEGAKILDEGIAERASDIDVVWCNGYGWPRATGGPMYWAERIGLQRVIDGLEKHGDWLGCEFSISPLLYRCARLGLPLGSESTRTSSQESCHA